MKLYLWMNRRGAIVNTEILSMTFGAEPAARQSDLGRLASSTSVHDILVVVPSSCPHLPTLMQASIDGNPFADAFITCVVEGGRGRTIAHSKYRLKDVLISRFDCLGETNGVEVGLSFTQIELSYKQAQG